jgi:hypothetical protein
MEQNEAQEQPNKRPWMYKKGQSGNPGGRTKGSKSMKTYIAERLAVLSEDKREEFLDGLSKEVIWKMAEGAPSTQTDITTKGEKLNVVSPESLALAKEYEEKLKKNI